MTARNVVPPTRGTRAAAVAFIDRAIEVGKPITPLRDFFIKRHIENPERVEAEIDALTSMYYTSPPPPTLSPQDQRELDHNMAASNAVMNAVSAGKIPQHLCMLFLIKYLNNPKETDRLLNDLPLIDLAAITKKTATLARRYPAKYEAIHRSLAHMLGEEGARNYSIGSRVRKPDRHAPTFMGVYGTFLWVGIYEPLRRFID